MKFNVISRYNIDGASRGQPGRFGQKPFQPPADMRQVCINNIVRAIPPPPSYTYCQVKALFIVKINQYIDRLLYVFLNLI